ncbi:MAG: hypothetical protein ACI8X5_001966 [Planctomycetota bacterium]|jgi:hypothetical protein
MNESSDREKDEASYVCDSCGEEIVIPIDYSAGREQEYVEDCPVCCNANVIRVFLQPDGGAHVASKAE